MAVVVLVDGVFTLNGVNLTDHVKSVSLEIEGAEIDTSSITSDLDEGVLGRKSFSLSVEAMDDFAAGSTDATVWGAFNTGTAIPFTFKATSAATSATNPQWSGNVLPSKSPVGGGAGDLLTKSLSLKGTGAITRAVA